MSSQVTLNWIDDVIMIQLKMSHMHIYNHVEMPIVHSPIPSKLAFITTYNHYIFICLFGFRSAVDM